MAKKDVTLRSLASVAASRAGLAELAGLTFGGERDLYEALGYKKELEGSDHRGRYERGGIAGRIVEAFPKATWRGIIKVVDDVDPNNLTPFQTEWELLQKRLRVYSILLRADILAGLGRFSVILIGAKGNFESELTSISGQEGVLYLTPYSQLDFNIKEYVVDSQDPRFGLPLIYTTTRLDSTGDDKDTDVHWSRVIHIADGILDEQALGMPRLQQPWNKLDDLDKVTGGGSEAFWLRAHQGYQLDADPDLEMNDAEAEELSDEITEFINGYRRIVQTRGIKMNPLGSDVASFKDQAGAILDQISGITGIPKRILIGSERGELASTQDRANWNDRVEDRRTQFAEPVILRQLVDRLILLKALPVPDEEEYEILWPKLQNIDAVERSEIADKLSGINKKIGGTIILPAEIRAEILELPPIEDVGGEIDIEEGVTPDTEDGEIEEGTIAAAEKKSFHLLMNLRKSQDG